MKSGNASSKTCWILAFYFQMLWSVVPARFHIKILLQKLFLRYNELICPESTQRVCNLMNNEGQSHVQFTVWVISFINAHDYACFFQPSEISVWFPNWIRPIIKFHKEIILSQNCFLKQHCGIVFCVQVSFNAVRVCPCLIGKYNACIPWI